MAKMLALIQDPRCELHDVGGGHPEQPERMRVLAAALRRYGSHPEVAQLEGRDAQLEELAWVHDRDYVERVSASADQPVQMFDGDTGVGPQSWLAARRAAGSAMVGVEAICSGNYRYALSLGRPPGHHAEWNRAMGFCLFNNVAVAAEYARRRSGLSRLAILDWDVHHGNGTQNIFYSREDICYASIHQHPHYPGSGLSDERGVDAGLGATLNLPQPAGQGDEQYQQLFREKIIPTLRRWKPQMIIVSAGFDAHRDDPLGGMRLSAAGFGVLTEQVRLLAEEICQGRLLLVLEGGYNLAALSESVQAVVATLITH